LGKNRSPDQFDGLDLRFEIGATSDSAMLSWTGDNQPIMNIVGSKPSIRRVAGRLLLSTQVRDRSGAMVVDITDNRWKVSSAQNVSWDKNYTRNALEAKDGRGRVVLQVVLMPESVRFQGEWWPEDGNGGRVMRPFPIRPGEDQPYLRHNAAPVPSR
jgi:hypothetical protein